MSPSEFFALVGATRNSNEFLGSRTFFPFHCQFFCPSVLPNLTDKYCIQVHEKVHHVDPFRMDKQAASCLIPGIPNKTIILSWKFLIALQENELTSQNTRSYQESDFHCVTRRMLMMTHSIVSTHYPSSAAFTRHLTPLVRLSGCTNNNACSNVIKDPCECSLEL
jgi:hypothetical protein